MIIDLSDAERMRLNELSSSKDSDVTFLAELVGRILYAIDSDEDYRREQEEI